MSFYEPTLYDMIHLRSKLSRKVVTFIQTHIDGNMLALNEAE